MSSQNSWVMIIMTLFISIFKVNLSYKISFVGLRPHPYLAQSITEKMILVTGSHHDNHRQKNFSIDPYNILRYLHKNNPLHCRYHVLYDHHFWKSNALLINVMIFVYARYFLNQIDMNIWYKYAPRHCERYLQFCPVNKKLAGCYMSWSGHTLVKRMPSSLAHLWST